MREPSAKQQRKLRGDALCRDWPRHLEGELEDEEKEWEIVQR